MTDDAVTRAALVLDAHSRAGLAAVQSLGRHGVVVDVASEESCLAGRSRYRRHELRQPRSSDPETFRRWLGEVAEANAYALVVPATEVSLRGLLALPRSDPMRGSAVLPPDDSLRVALDKVETCRVASELGIPVPRARLLRAPDAGAEPDRFPVVLKPARSIVPVGSRFMGLTSILVRNAGEWNRGLDRLLPRGPVLEQEFVPGGGVGVECLYRDGSALWHFQHERVHELPLTGGGSSYRRSVPADERLLGHARSLLDSLRWHGVAMVEFKGAPERGYTLMEINPRLWGSLSLSLAAGVDFPVGLWRLARGEDPGPQPPYRPWLYARHLETDIDWMKENLRADHRDPLLLTRPRWRSVLEIARPLLGAERWDHFDLSDRGVWVGVLRRSAAKVIRTLTGPLQRWSHLPQALRHERILDRLRGNGGARSVLFVCYGNVCRSPLAERYARSLLPGLEFESSGFHTASDRTAPSWYRELAAEVGVDLSRCRSRRLDAAQVERADLILLADESNLNQLRREFPSALPKATLLGLFAARPRLSIEDPFKLDSARGRRAVRAVMDSVEGFARWCEEAPGTPERSPAP